MMGATPDQDLRDLFLLSRRFRDGTLSLTERIESLIQEIEDWRFSPMANWERESLQHARHFAEEITILYVSYFYDLRRIPVTYYRREKAIRRKLDGLFSGLFKEIIRRTQGPAEPELITQEPIYWLLQKAREKSFPKAPKSQDRRPHLETLRIRFHLELARRLDSTDSRDLGDRRVLLPYEI